MAEQLVENERVTINSYHNQVVGKLIIFCAPSGSGKTTLVKHLLSKFEKKMAFSVSATTREPREGEINGLHYHFLSRETFEKMVEDDCFVEFEEVYTGTYYGTLKAELERLWAEEKIVLFDVDVKGGLRLKNIFGSAALSIFVKVPNLDVLEKRLIARETENAKSIEKRMAKAAFELSFEKDFDCVVLNDSLETACNETENLVMKFLEA